MLRAHKIRLNPTPEQEQYLRQACGVARHAFNWGLAEWQRQYEAGGKPSAYALRKQYNSIRREQFPWTYDVTKCAVDTGFRNLHNAFEGFFRRCKNGDVKKGYPKFKTKKRSRLSFWMDGARVSTDGYWLRLQKLKEPINMTEKLRFDGEIRHVVILEDADHWYAAICVKVQPPEHEHPRESVGVDLGIRALATLSDGRVFENQEPLRSELRKLRRLNRELSRRQQGSGRWQVTRRKLAKLHRRIANRRLDYLHKMTTEIAKTYRVVGVEDLGVNGMLKNRRLALSIADAGFGTIKGQLKYKTEWYGGILVEIDRFFPSSKTCSVCGCVNNDLTLSDRTWACDCGAVLDRDRNAALNIERRALVVLGRGGSTDQVRKNGRGRDVRPLGAIPGEASKLA